MNLFKIIAHQTCGADPTTLLTLYRTLICSKLDYGAIVYNSACGKSSCKNLSWRHHTSPVSSLQVLAHELPLELRRLQHSVLYKINLIHLIQLIKQSCNHCRLYTEINVML